MKKQYLDSFCLPKISRYQNNQNLYSMSTWDLYTLYYIFIDIDDYPPNKARLMAELEMILAFERHTLKLWLVT